jgi:hypothetical protein
VPFYLRKRLDRFGKVRSCSLRASLVLSHLLVREQFFEFDYRLREENLMVSQDDGNDLKKVFREARSYAQQHLPELSRQIVHWKQTGLLPEVSGSVSMRKLADMLKVVDLHGSMQMAENMVKDAALETLARPLMAQSPDDAQEPSHRAVDDEAIEYARTHLAELSQQLMHWMDTGDLPNTNEGPSLSELGDILAKNDQSIAKEISFGTRARKKLFYAEVLVRRTALEAAAGNAQPVAVMVHARMKNR